MTTHMNYIYFFSPGVYHVLKAYILRAINTRIDYETNVLRCLMFGLFTSVEILTRWSTNIETCSAM
jgi:hypothetical protein